MIVGTGLLRREIREIQKEKQEEWTSVNFSNILDKSFAIFIIGVVVIGVGEMVSRSRIFK